MDEKNETGADAFGRVDYRRFVAWTRRIEREAPFLKCVLEKAPSMRVLDLGCGTGEHSRFLNSLDCEVVGVDRSATMIRKAKEEPVRGGVEFVLGDIRELPPLLTAEFGMAIALGNTLTGLVENEDLEKFLSGLRTVTDGGALFLFQILNYKRIFSQGIRYLPLNLVDDDDGSTTIFLRLMNRLPKGRVEFCPSTLKYDPESDPPLLVTQSQVITLRGWHLEELQGQLQDTGFEVEGVYGDMLGGVFDPEESHDLVVLSRRTAD
ncbi:MAG TPA: class I SAM-dependent methyltransferase [Acidobacteriota bacterium]|nr:class I SAM-dependent methyltransferase [Acidobacteriota bacterium]